MWLAFLHRQVHSFQQGFLTDLKLDVLLCSAMPERSYWAKLFPLNLPGSNLGQPAIRIILTTLPVGRAVVRLQRWLLASVLWRWAHKPLAPLSVPPPFVALSGLNQPMDVFLRRGGFHLPPPSILLGALPRKLPAQPPLRPSPASPGITRQLV